MFHIPTNLLFPPSNQPPLQPKYSPPSYATLMLQSLLIQLQINPIIIAPLMLPPLTDTKIRNVITQLFPTHDKNGNGRLTKSQFITFLDEAVDKLDLISGMKADQALMMFDRNWDGEISKEEAYTMLRYMVGKEMEGEYKLSKVEKCLMEDDDQDKPDARIDHLLGDTVIPKAGSTVQSYIPSRIPSHIPSQPSSTIPSIIPSVQPLSPIKLTSSTVVSTQPNHLKPSPTKDGHSILPSPKPVGSFLMESVTYSIDRSNKS